MLSFKYSKKIIILIITALLIISTVAVLAVSLRKVIKIMEGKVTDIKMSLSNLEHSLNTAKMSLSTIEHSANIDNNALRKGLQQIAKRKVVICGIARDNADDLPRVIAHIQNTGRLFKDYRVIIFENDSNDGTKNILSEWSSNNNKVKIISKDYGNKKRPSIKFLAEARNFYLEELEQNHEYDRFDTVMVVDLDMKFGWNIKGVADSFSRIDEWDAVCSNGLENISGNMYDAFAFRNQEFPNGPREDPNYWQKSVRFVQKMYPIGGDLVPVRSCFGGLAFFKRKFINKCRYDSPKGDCEHIPFHDCLNKQNGGKMVMNPSQFLMYSHWQ